MTIDAMSYDELKLNEGIAVESIGMLRQSMERQQEMLRLLRARIEIVKAVDKLDGPPRAQLAQLGERA